MPLLCLGLSHRTAPVELRERLSFDSAALTSALARFGCGCDALPRGLSELAILSTCGRTELYAVVASHAADPGAPVLDFLAETRAVPPAELQTGLYQHTGEVAARHLCRVAAGLDSMVLGEPQILGQVAEAFQAAQAHGAAGPLLSALFRAAIRAGKRARSETGISRDPASISSVAVRLAETAAGALDQRHVLVIGAGEMAELAVEALRTRGARQVTVVNRTLARAQALSEPWGANSLTYEALAGALAEADIVIASTGAPHFVVTRALAESVLAGRAGRPLVFIDIALPRNVDPAIAELPGAHVFDLDDLNARLSGAIESRQREVPRVEAIVDEETAAFADWQRQLDIVPLIADLRARAEAIRQAEVEKTLRHMPQLGEAERARIHLLSNALVNRLLHDPTLRLKAEAGNGHAAQYAAVVRELFALNG